MYTQTQLQTSIKLLGNRNDLLRSGGHWSDIHIATTKAFQALKNRTYAY